MDIAPDLVDLGYCPFALLTGKPCVLCGGSRALFALFRGQLHEAYQLNVSVFLIVIAFFLFALKKGTLVYKSKNWELVKPSILIGELGDTVRRNYRVSIFVGLLWWIWNIQRW